MIVITVDTRNFELVALGRTVEEAENGLLKRWTQHCANNPSAEPGFMAELIAGGDAMVYDIDPGQGRMKED